MIYSNFAAVYDRLMRDVPYGQWIEYLSRLFIRHSIKPQSILDIGCGTGNVTIPLSEMGYQLTGLDVSAEMLAVAEEKSRNRGLKINWLQQDMRKMDLGDTRFDLVISMTDSLNYINRPEELQHIFGLVQSLLNPGGWLIFDLNSEYKLKSVFGDNTFTLLEADVAYIWENRYSHTKGSCDMEVTFFVEESDGKYRRFTERHREKAYQEEQVKELLNKSGLETTAVYSETSFRKPTAKTERIYFVARKGQ